MRYEVPPVEQTHNHHEIMAHALELLRSNGRSDARTQGYWNQTAHHVAREHANPIPASDINRGGSWNHPVAGMVLLVLMEEDESWNDLKQYCIWQLNDTHKGMWGQEGLSHIYPHPIPYLAMAYEQQQMPEIRQLLRAHAYLLTLLALPKPYRREAGETGQREGPYTGGDNLDLHVCCGGMRSQWPFRGNVFLSYALQKMLRLPAPLPTWRNSHRRIQGWSNRVMHHTRHLYLTDEQRSQLHNHIRNPTPEPLIAMLKSLGVRSRARLEVARYPGGLGYSFLAKNTHGSTPPLMGQSLTHDGYHTLGLHPDRLRGTDGGNRVGTVTAELDGGWIRGRAKNVRSGGNQGNWPPVEIDGVPAQPGQEARDVTVIGKIPIPGGEPLFKVVIDQNGVNQGPPVVSEDDPRVISALLLFDQVATGLGGWEERNMRIAAEGMRRIARSNRSGAIRATERLGNVLREAPIPPTPPDVADDSRVIQALLHFDQVASELGGWPEDSMRVAAEMMRRIAKRNKPGAIKATRRLGIVLE